MALARSLSLGAVLTVGLILAQPDARADVAPPNSCNAAGQSCSTALGPNGQYTANGTCVSTMCGHVTPQPDGSLSTTQYPCTLCEASDAGASSGSGSGSGSTSDSGSSGSKGGGGGGCSIGRFSAVDLAPFGLVAAGAALLAASRRRRDRS